MAVAVDLIERAVWARLSPRARITLRCVVLPMTDGLRQAEIADALGISRSRMAGLVAELRRELRAQDDNEEER